MRNLNYFNFIIRLQIKGFFIVRLLNKFYDIFIFFVFHAFIKQLNN